MKSRKKTHAYWRNPDDGVIPIVLVDVLRSVVALVLCSVIMLLFLVRLETTFLRLG